MLDKLFKRNFEREEFDKRDKELVLIASENYPSQKVLDACGSIFTLKYAEGFPRKRYYQGCEIVDDMEQTCINTCLELFNATNGYYANVQPNSGASANMIVYNAVLEPNDTVLAMDVKAGGHISHSHPKSFLAKYHNVVTYGVDDNGFLDYDEIERIATECQPKLIVAGASNYPRTIDFARFKNIANKVGALLMADIAHISILCAHGEHPSPVGMADFITFTTHKCLKGPRGGVIIYKSEFEKAIRMSTIPGLFGGPLENQVYAKLVCFQEAMTRKAKEYTEQIIKNARMMAEVFKASHIPIVTKGTDNHLVTVDLRDFKISGKEMAERLEKCGVICNCNTVPNDPRSFLETSGIRLGVPAITARGFDYFDTQYLINAMALVINSWREVGTYTEEHAEKEELLKEAVKVLTKKYPLRKIYKRR